MQRSVIATGACGPILVRLRNAERTGQQVPCEKERDKLQRRARQLVLTARGATPRDPPACCLVLRAEGVELIDPILSSHPRRRVRPLGKVLGEGAGKTRSVRQRD